MSSVKEPGYFSRRRVRAPVRARIPILSDINAYLKLFDGATDQHKIVGESSTSYLRDEVALREIREFAGNPKIIILIRDPVRLVSSYFRFLQYQGFEPLQTLREAWAVQDKRCAGVIDSPNVERPDSLAYRDVALLGRQVQTIFSIFDRANVLVIQSQDILENPLAVGMLVQDFLGIQSYRDIEFPRDNVSRVARFQSIDAMIKRLPPSAIAFKDNVKRLLGVHSLGIRAFFDKYNAVPKSHSVPPDLQQSMREFLVPTSTSCLNCWGKISEKYGAGRSVRNRIGFNRAIYRAHTRGLESSDLFS